DVTDLQPKERDVAMVFQNYALYPYLTVGANIGFPLRIRRVKKAVREQRVREVAKLLGLEEYLDRKPAQLSGGQRQRVAMGRAIIFVAGFIGSPAMNLCTLAASNGHVSLGGVDVPVPNGSANGIFVLGVRPESLEVANEGVPARVEVVEDVGADAYVFCSAEL